MKKELVGRLSVMEWETLMSLKKIPGKGMQESLSYSSCGYKVGSRCHLTVC